MVFGVCLLILNKVIIKEVGHPCLLNLLTPSWEGISLPNSKVWASH